MRTNTRGDGSVRIYPSPRCKRCSAEDQRKRRAAEPEEERRRKKREESAKRRKENRAKVNRYGRKWWRTKAREAGIPHRGYRIEDREFLPAEPIQKWISSRKLPSDADANMKRRVRSLRAQEYKWVALATIDALSQLFEEPGLQTELYGDTKPLGHEQIIRHD